jgi:hypothetical protein
MTPERLHLYADVALGFLIIIGLFWLCGVMSRDIPDDYLDED